MVKKRHRKHAVVYGASLKVERYLWEIRYPNEAWRPQPTEDGAPQYEYKAEYNTPYIASPQWYVFPAPDDATAYATAMERMKGCERAWVFKERSRAKKDAAKREQQEGATNV